MDSVLLVIVAVLILMNLKWILITVIFPLQVANKVRAKIKKETGHRNIVLYLLSAPYILWERLMRGGWERYMLFQVAVVPSLHFRKWIYRCLGATIGKNVVFHFKTEVRAPERLVVGGGVL